MLGPCRNPGSGDQSTARETPGGSLSSSQLSGSPAIRCFSGHWLLEKKCSPREMGMDWLYQSPVSTRSVEHGGDGKLPQLRSTSNPSPCVPTGRAGAVKSCVPQGTGGPGAKFRQYRAPPHHVQFLSSQRPDVHTSSRGLSCVRGGCEDWGP